MGIDAQLNKGVLEGCVLRLLEQDLLFSAEIVGKMRASGFADFSEGTLYPMLLRLEKEGCFEIKRVPSPNGPPKKYYTLSAAGKMKLALFEEQWNNLTRNIANVFAEKEDVYAEQDQ